MKRNKNRFLVALLVFTFCVEASRADDELEQAILTADISRVKQSIAFGADVDNKIDNELTIRPILLSTELLRMNKNKKVIPIIKELIKNKVNLFVVDYYGETPLLHIAAEKQPDLVNLFVETLPTSAFINHKNNDFGETALHKAAEQGDLESVKILIQAGARKDIKNNKGLTALDLAKKDNKIAVVEFLQTSHKAEVKKIASKNNYSKELFKAAQGGKTKIIQNLIDKGVDFDVQDKNGNTAYHIAAQKGRASVVKLLLSEGDIDENPTNNDGNEPIHEAAKYDHATVIKIILDNDSDEVDAQNNNNGFTPLHYAAQAGNVKAAKMLIQYDADLDDQDNNGNTPLHLAVMAGQDMPILKLLISKGANVAINNNNGETAEYIAQQEGDDEAIQLLQKAK